MTAPDKAASPVHIGRGMLERLLVVVAAWDVHLEHLVMDTPDDQAMVTQLRDLLPSDWRPIIDDVRERTERANASGRVITELP